MKIEKKIDFTVDKGKLTSENHPNCPECGSSNTSSRYANCLCHITDSEGLRPTCWSMPVCNSCGHQGYYNSKGIYWYGG